MAHLHDQAVSARRPVGRIDHVWYGVAKGLDQVLRQCGDDVTRENVMKQAANLDFEIGVYLPDAKIRTSPTDFAPLEQLQMMRFKGESWKLFGPVMSGEKSS